jgi:hypothetical protein
MHRTLKQEAGRSPGTNLKTQGVKLSQFQYEYNFVRPHEALSMATPASIYTPSTRKWTGDLMGPVYSDEYERRKVDKGGIIKRKGMRFFVSEILYGETVGIKEVNHVHEVYFGPILLGRIDPVRGFKKT